MEAKRLYIRSGKTHIINKDPGISTTSVYFEGVSLVPLPIISQHTYCFKPTQSDTRFAFFLLRAGAGNWMDTASQPHRAAVGGGNIKTGSPNYRCESV